ncbi:MAG: glucokinase [Pseudomonadota bacterium]
MTNHPLLIADIGGTNARFALATEQAPFFDQAQTLQCIDYATVEDAIDTYLQSHGLEQLGGICFAVAGPIQFESVSFTNSHWTIKSSELRSRYSIERAQLLNDFEAIAYSLAQLSREDVVPIGPEGSIDTDQDFSFGVLGPGSGLGVAGLIQREGHLYPLPTECGHVGFAPDNEQQDQIMQVLRTKFGRVSNERLLSGPGLVNIHEALCEINHVANPGLAPADIAVAAREKTDPLCMETMEIFFQVMGQVAGDTALAMGAYQGIFIGGGITQRYPNQLANSRFRAGFENKGRHRDLVEKIPTWLITHINPGLLGASVYARNYL